MFTGLKIQYQLTDAFLSNMLPKDHELVKLKKILDWKSINRIYKECYPSRRGPGTKSTDLALGLILLKQYYNLSWERLVQSVHENIAMMYFCSVSFETVAELQHAKKRLITSSAMVKIMKRLGAARIRKIERLFFHQIKKAGLIEGKLLITDTTSLEKNIAYPTEINLLGRVIEHGERIIQGVAKKSQMIKSAAIRKAKTIAKVFYSARRKTTELLRSTGNQLLKLAKEQVKKAKKSYTGSSKAFRRKLKKVMEKLTTVGEKIITQVEEKMQGGSPKDKIVSYNEPYARALPKGKVHKTCEFGSKVRLDMSDNGYITNNKVYKGNPNDSTMLNESIQEHSENFGDDFSKVTADRGFADELGEAKLEKDYGIKVVIPGKKEKPRELTMEEKKIYDRRAAIEAKISEGKRCAGLGRCRYAGFEGDEICVSLGSLVLNARKLIREMREHPKIILKFEN